MIRAGDVQIGTDGLDLARASVLLEQRVRNLAPSTGPQGRSVAALECLIGGERFAIPLREVAEAVPLASATPVPGAPAALLGLVVRRGLLYNLIDPAPALGVTASGGKHMIMLRGPTPRFALRIDEAIGTIEAPIGEGPVRPGGDGGLTETMVDADGGCIGLLAPRRLIEALGLRIEPAREREGG